MQEDIFDIKIARIEPVYEYDFVAGGYFALYIGDNDSEPFKLSFAPFLNDRIEKDKALFEYLEKKSKDSTISHAIYDLYDIGFPVDEWVQEYLDDVKSKVDPKLLQALFTFYNYIKKFGDPSGSLE